MSTSSAEDWNDSDPPLIYRSWRTVCAASFLIYASLGGVLPMLSLFLRTSTGMTWFQVSAVVAGFPFGSAFILPIIRGAKQRHYDPRLGTALGQLLFSFVAMSVSITAQEGALLKLDWRLAVGISVIIGILSTWTLSWLNELAGQTSPSNPRAAREWRLWGAVGFVVPAWCVELLVGSATTADWDQFALLYSISAWSGLVGVIVLLLAWRQELSVPIAEPQATNVAPRNSLSLPLLAACVAVAVLQRCHELWVTPFIENVLELHGVRVQLSLRLSVVSHVAEVATLYGLGRIVWVIGPRLTMLLGLGFWLSRCLVLGWVAQTPLSARAALTNLFFAQILAGIGTVLFAGAAAVVLGRQLRSSRDALSATVFWSSLMAALGLLVVGTITDAALTKVGLPMATRVVNLWPERWEVGSYVLILREWSGLWFGSAVLPLVAMVLLCLSRLRTSLSD